jgi:hypothetical protein
MRWTMTLLTGMILAAALAAPSARATPNMPLVCPVQVLNGACSSPTYTLQPGAAGLFVATPSGQWTEWGALTADASVRACPQDVAPGGTCPVARVTLSKAQVAAVGDTPPPILATFPVKVSWVAPAQTADGSPLASSDVVGYGLEWRTDGETAYHVVTLGPVTEYAFNPPKQRICLHLYTIGTASNSANTPDTCIVPKAAAPGVPANVTVTFGEP